MLSRGGVVQLASTASRSSMVVVAGTGSGSMLEGVYGGGVVADTLCWTTASENIVLCCMVTETARTLFGRFRELRRLWPRHAAATAKTSRMAAHEPPRTIHARVRLGASVSRSSGFVRVDGVCGGGGAGEGGGGGGGSGSGDGGGFGWPGLEAGGTDGGTAAKVVTVGVETVSTGTPSVLLAAAMSFVTRSVSVEVICTATASAVALAVAVASIVARTITEPALTVTLTLSTGTPAVAARDVRKATVSNASTVVSRVKLRATTVTRGGGMDGGGSAGVGEDGDGGGGDGSGGEGVGGGGGRGE